MSRLLSWADRVAERFFGVIERHFELTLLLAMVAAVVIAAVAVWNLP